MFKIYDGREHFYQWDLDRKLIVEDKSITEVHFCNRTGSCSLLRNVYEVNGMYLVDVPNILLQDNWDIKVYGFDSNYTKHSASYDVHPRTRPENYVYTEEEQYKWEQLEDRIDQIEQEGISEESINNAVYKYLEANPVEVPVESVNGKTGAIELTAADVHALPDTTVIPSTTGLASEEYVNEAIKKIDIPEVDLSDYYTKGQVDNLIPDTSGFATTKYVDDAVKKIDVPEVDLTNYYNKQEVDAKIPDTTGFALKTDIPDVSGFTTMGAVEAKGYQTEAEVNALINTALGVIENGTY